MTLASLLILLLGLLTLGIYLDAALMLRESGAVRRPVRMEHLNAAAAHYQRRTRYSPRRLVFTAIYAAVILTALVLLLRGG